ncbi:MAG: hypothetical protein R2710_12795 [Acidimicrobiales bacterium]
MLSLRLGFSDEGNFARRPPLARPTTARRGFGPGLGPFVVVAELGSAQDLAAMHGLTGDLSADPGLPS